MSAPITLPDTLRNILHTRLIAACHQSFTGRITGTLDALSRIVGMRVSVSDLNALLLSGRVVYGLGARDEFVVRALESGI
jgi:hypothetical protein